MVEICFHSYVGGHSGLTLAKVLLCACIIMFIVLVSVAPKLLCRWCHNKESHSKDEDDVVYGEVRYPDESHHKHMHTTHCSNALYKKCNGSANGNSCSDSSTLPAQVNDIPPARERYVSHAPPSNNDCNNDNNIVMTPESIQMILENKTITKDNSPANEREATCTPEVPLYCGSDLDDDGDDKITMTPNPSYTPKEDNNATANRTKLVPEGEAAHTHTLDAPPRDDNGVKMTRNPSYSLGSDFYPDANTPDSTKLLPPRKRDASLTPPTSPYNDRHYVGIAQTASCSLVRKFSAEPICDITKSPADYIEPIPSYNREHSHNVIKKPDISDDDIIMTNNPSYQFEKDFFEQ